MLSQVTCWLLYTKTLNAISRFVIFDSLIISLSSKHWIGIRSIYVVQHNKQQIFLLQNNLLYYWLWKLLPWWKFYPQVLSSITVVSSHSLAETCVGLLKILGNPKHQNRFPVLLWLEKWREDLERRSKLGF